MTLEPSTTGVAEAPKAINPLEIPDGVNPMVFRAVLAAFTTGWRVLGRTPTLDETHAYWPKITKVDLGRILVTPEFREACAKRGITLSDTPGLTHTQHLVLMALSDRRDKRSEKAKIEACGATTQQVANWERQPVYQAARRALAARIWEDGLPTLQSVMLDQAAAGSFQQQQYIMDTLGEGPKAREQQSARETVQRLVAAVQRATVGHPDIRRAIMEEMQSEMQMAALTATQ